MMNSRTALCALFILLAVRHAALETVRERERRAISASQCAYRSDLFASYRSLCPQACTNTTVCPSNWRCECHYACGMACLDVTAESGCGTLQVDNGKVVTTPYNRQGALAVYSCNAQYVLVGKSERVCLSTRQWSGNAPSCERVFCNQPPPIVNGRPVLNDSNRFPVGAEVEYECDEGYVALGVFKASCTSSGSWSKVQMACMPISCGHPGTVPNSRMIGDMFVFGSTVIYYCDVGYSLVGSTMIKCLSTGLWSSRPPNCTAIDCGPLAAPRNGYVVNGATRYNSIAEYRCVAGYQVKGAERRMCQLDGTWDGSEPTCELANCNQLPRLINGLVNCTNRINGECNTMFGAQVAFQCDSYSQMDATDTTTAVCNARGQWEPALPTCWRHCDLPNVINGTLNVSNIEASLETRDAVAIKIDGKLYIRNGSILKNEYVICGESGDYILANENRVICSNGTFLREPRCVPAPCKIRPPGLQFGMVRFTRMLHGYRARYSCHPGYQLAGNDTAICLFGKWRFPQNTLPPVCNELVCPSPLPQSFTNGKIYMIGIKGKYEVQPHQTKFQHSNALEFICDSNYKLFGPTYQTCVDGQWSPLAQPQCIFETCIPLNHDMTKKVNMTMKPEAPDQFVLEVTVECRNGYTLTGNSSQASCVNGEWVPNVPECLPNNCTAASMLQALSINQASLQKYNFEIRNYKLDKPATIGLEMNNELRNNFADAFTQHGHTVEVSCRRDSMKRLSLECAYGAWIIDGVISC